MPWRMQLGLRCHVWQHLPNAENCFSLLRFGQATAERAAVHGRGRTGLSFGMKLMKGNTFWLSGIIRIMLP